MRQVLHHSCPIFYLKREELEKQADLRQSILSKRADFLLNGKIKQELDREFQSKLHKRRAQ